MEFPLEVIFRNMVRSETVETKIREKAAKLTRVFDRIVSCRVVVEAPRRLPPKGKPFVVRVEVTVPGKGLLVTRSGSKDKAHDDVRVAVRDAFNAAARKLEDHARRIRGQVKTHEAPRHGKVARLFAYEGYGFIETSEGREIYFHKNSVVNDGFEQLDVGSEVRLVVAYGESADGPQASTVTPVGKHHIVE